MYNRLFLHLKKNGLIVRQHKIFYSVISCVKRIENSVIKIYIFKFSNESSLFEQTKNKSVSYSLRQIKYILYQSSNLSHKITTFSYRQMQYNLHPNLVAAAFFSQKLKNYVI